MSSAESESAVPRGIPGQGLEVRRGLITPQLAAVATKQALLLNGLTTLERVSFTHRHTLPDAARPVLAVSLAGLAGRGLDRQFSALLAVYDLTEEIVGNGADTLYLDFYDGGGQGRPISGKVDPGTKKTIWVGLRGGAGIRVMTATPEEGQPEFKLKPTDGVYLDHAASEGPQYASWNTSVTSRIDLING
jgi:hypothetical protein